MIEKRKVNAWACKTRAKGHALKLEFTGREFICCNYYVRVEFSVFPACSIYVGHCAVVSRAPGDQGRQRRFEAS